ncbi:putative light- and oxygen-sensing transcription regulator [Haloferax larsenii JCM 13917]|nr:PAS domain-containing protein [Haloferax larsenii]ELZ78242.1 putative light- and oxygen-sensing transcription regulator [Haloferax larsenii JCM 13917]
MEGEVSFLELAFDELPTEVAILDSHGDIVYTNRAWRTFASANGYVGSPDSLGVNYLDTCDAARDDEEVAGVVADGIRGLLQGTQDLFSVEYPCHSSSEFRWFTMQAVPFDTPRHGRFVLVVHQNITERRLVELQVSGTNRQLAMLVGFLSAELREPLSSAMETASRLVAADGADAAVLAEALERMDSVVEQSVALSNQGTRVDTQPVDFRSAIEVAWADIDHAGVSLRIVGHGHLMADAHLFGLFCKLLLNHSSHRDATAASLSRIIVGTTADGFFIDDDGPQMPAEERAQFSDDELLGADYEMVDTAIVSRIADLHGWRLEVTDSELGGARYEVGEVTWT